MAYELDDRLKRWIGTIAAGVTISLDPPRTQPAGQGIGLYLLELQRSTAISTVKPAPLQISTKYLVTSWAEDVVKAHDLLTELCFAAMESTEFEVESGTPPLELWRAFGVAPQPCFLLRVPVVHERPQTRAPLVRKPVRVEIVSRVAFQGRVLGPGDQPLPGCSVEIPSLGLATRSDHDGRFLFAGLPASGNTEILLRARGRQLSIRSEQNLSETQEPIVIRFNSLED